MAVCLSVCLSVHRETSEEACLCCESRERTAGTSPRCFLFCLISMPGSRHVNHVTVILQSVWMSECDGEMIRDRMNERVCVETTDLTCFTCIHPTDEASHMIMFYDELVFSGFSFYWNNSDEPVTRQNEVTWSDCWAEYLLTIRLLVHNVLINGLLVTCYLWKSFFSWPVSLKLHCMAKSIRTPPSTCFCVSALMKGNLKLQHKMIIRPLVPFWLL